MGAIRSFSGGAGGRAPPARPDPRGSAVRSPVADAPGRRVLRRCGAQSRQL